MPDSPETEFDFMLPAEYRRFLLSFDMLTDAQKEEINARMDEYIQKRAQENNIK